MTSRKSVNDLVREQLRRLQGLSRLSADDQQRLQLVALAFACNFNRVAILQHGDGTDGTKYAVPSNAELGWPFHQISHRIQSDSATSSGRRAQDNAILAASIGAI